MLVFADQAGFYLLPGAVGTYASVGQTPIIRAPLSRDHLSAMGGITPEGELYLMVPERAYRRREVVRSQAVKRYMGRGAARRIHLEQFPSYAPELNPASCFQGPSRCPDNLAPLYKRCSDMMSGWLPMLQEESLQPGGRGNIRLVVPLLPTPVNITRNRREGDR